ncbi:MAG: HlyD family efflux transporter periplasmic adaptor subunit [Magnetococcales bacterium]|nr:HlyD family efflux transporter periplasmic adaptor subunit [Magnetococcales bacterium]
MSPKAQNRPIRRPFKRVLADLAGVGYLAVWLVAVGAIGLILRDRLQVAEYTGLAQGSRYHVSATIPGRIDQLHVELYDRVFAGQLVATLEDDQVMAKLNVAKAKLDLSRTELKKAHYDVVDGVGAWQGEMRRFAMDEAQWRLEALAMQVALETDRVELEKVHRVVERLRSRHVEGYATDAELDAAVLEEKRLRKQIAGHEKQLRQTQANRRDAGDRLKGFVGNLSMDGDPTTIVMAPLQVAIEVEEARLEEIRVERRKLILRAPVAGKVSQVLGRAGQSLRVGESVVLIDQGVASEVVAYLPESQSRNAQVSQPVQISRSSDPTTVADSLVLRISPTIEPIPERLWPTPDRPIFGRPIVLAPSATLPLLPGEKVQVRLLSTTQ